MARYKIQEYNKVETWKENMIDKLRVGIQRAYRDANKPAPRVYTGMLAKNSGYDLLVLPYEQDEPTGKITVMGKRTIRFWMARKVNGDGVPLPDADATTLSLFSGSLRYRTIDAALTNIVTKTTPLTNFELEILKTQQDNQVEGQRRCKKVRDGEYSSRTKKHNKQYARGDYWRYRRLIDHSPDVIEAAFVLAFKLQTKQEGDPLSAEELGLARYFTNHLMEGRTKYTSGFWQRVVSKIENKVAKLMASGRL